MEPQRDKDAQGRREALKKAVPARLPNLYVSRLKKQQPILPPRRGARWPLPVLFLILAGLYGWLAMRERGVVRSVPPPLTPATVSSDNAASSQPSPKEGPLSPTVVPQPTGPVPVQPTHPEPGVAKPESSPGAEAKNSKPETQNVEQTGQVEQLLKPRGWSGNFCAIRDFRSVVINDINAWRSWWEEIGEVGPAPVLDFNQLMVVGIFLGQQPAKGYRIELAEGEENAGEKLVNWKVITPSAEVAGNNPAATQPFRMLLIPRTEKKIRFVKIEG